MVIQNCPVIYVQVGMSVEVMESSYNKVKSCYCGTDGIGEVLDYQIVPMLT